jgi:hypothetical protein
MNEKPPSAPKRSGFFRRKKAPAYQPWDELRRRETAAGLALLKARRRSELDERRLKNLISMWPVGAGIALAAFAPLLKAGAELVGPWTVALIFPFVVLAQRPELQVGPITHMLPTFMLFAQFPIEGLLARIILRRQVLPVSVAVQVLLFHFLGIVEVWMLNGASQPIVPH